MASTATSQTGFKVYGSLFKVDARYQFLNALGKGSYGIVWCVLLDRIVFTLCKLLVWGIAECNKLIRA